MILAVLEKRAGLPFGQLDVFVNVAGGLRITEPAADLAVAAALASSLRDRPLPPGSAFIGEICLGGEIRPVAQSERRIAEADRMGMHNIFVAARGSGRNGGQPRSTGVPGVQELLQLLDR
jgi:DNA repair protein RadA/Sms